MLSKTDLIKIPKVEFHRHLDGSVRFSTILDLAKKNGLDLGVKSEDELHKKCKVVKPMANLQEVLDSFWITQKVLCNYEAIRRVTYENIEDAHRDGVVLSELRFATVFIAEGKTLKNDEIIEAVLDGVTQGRNKFGMQVGLIHILPRSLDFGKNQKAFEDILKYQKGPHKNAHLLCGFDLADAEEGSDPMDFEPMVRKAKEAGQFVTIHSGEDTDHTIMERTIRVFSPHRIGHGVKSWGHEETLKLLAERNIHLELCPTSNWLTHCVKNLKDHPFPKFYKRGVSISLNTDDPHLMGIDLVNEYDVAQKHFGLGAQDFHKINKEALGHTFLDKDARTYVEGKYFT